MLADVVLFDLGFDFSSLIEAMTSEMGVALGKIVLMFAALQVVKVGLMWVQGLLALREYEGYWEGEWEHFDEFGWTAWDFRKGGEGDKELRKERRKQRRYRS